MSCLFPDRPVKGSISTGDVLSFALARFLNATTSQDMFPTRYLSENNNASPCYSEYDPDLNPMRHIRMEIASTSRSLGTRRMTFVLSAISEIDLLLAHDVDDKWLDNSRAGAAKSPVG
jgi:hypothetical protein